MALQNNWVTYLERSYKAIKASLVARMKTLVTEITDYSESNIYVIIISSFAGLIEQLNYYIDNVARESFITTARRYSSMIKLTRLIDYNVKAKVSSTVDLKITALDSGGDPVNLTTADYILDAGIIVKNDDGIEFVTENKATIFLGTSSVIVKARQLENVSNENIGTTTSSADQTFQLNDNYREGSLQIEINSVTWSLVDTFAFSGPTDTHFIVRVNENKEAWVIFGDDTNGAIPPSSQIVYATYQTSEGINGNVEANTLIIFDVSTEPDPTGWAEIDSFEVNNPLASAGGVDEEGIEDIRVKAPLSLRTLDRAVTLQDHTDLALLVPGVGKAATIFDPKSKNVVIYIAPSEGGVAGGTLLTDVEDAFDDKKMLTTTIDAQSTGLTPLVMELDVTVKFRRSTTDATTDIKEALQEEFGFNKSSINRKIRKSDIIALIDNLDKVDFLSLDVLTTKPYPRIRTGSNVLESNWKNNVLPGSDQIYTWRLTINSSTTAVLHRISSSGLLEYDGEITYTAIEPGSPTYQSPTGAFEVGIWGTLGVDFIDGDSWEFKTYPYNEDIVFEDYTVPVYDETELTLTVNSQQISS